MWKADEADVENEKSLSLQNSEKEAKPKFSWAKASTLLWLHFKQAYTNRTVLIWSFWWAFNTTGFLLIINYCQLLWQQIDPDQENFYNGYVEAVLTLAGAISASVAGHSFKNSFQKFDMYLLTLCSLLQGGFTIVSALTNSIWVAYIMYVCSGCVYHFIITLVTAFVAKFLSDDSFALIFGINTMIGEPL
jgi:thiamine transporter 2/3